MAEATEKVALTKQEKKIQKGLERLRAKFGQDAVLARAAGAANRKEGQEKTNAAESTSKSGNAKNAEKVQTATHAAEGKRSSGAESTNKVCRPAVAIEHEVAEDRLVSVRIKKRRCSLNVPQFVWTGRNDVEIAWHVSMDLSLRNGPDAEVYLRRELSTFGATPSNEELAFLGGALLHCADRGFSQCVQLLLARSASVEYASSDPRLPRRIGSRTPLELAAARGHVDVCQALVKQGAIIGRAKEAAASLSQFGEHFADERAALLALFSGSTIRS